jgi:hypothetical protein
MEKQMFSNDFSLIDMLYNNQDLEICEYNLTDCRSLLKFNGNQKHEINIKIFNETIQYVFQFLMKMNEIENNTSYTILGNSYNIGIIIKGQQLKNINFKIPISYLQINDNIIINNNYIDWYDIKKNVLSFTQRDDNIRMNLHQILYNETTNINNILFIGGEFYAFGKIINYKKAIGITDFEGLRKDALLNNPQMLTFKVDYSTVNIIEIIEDLPIKTCVVNVLNGLGKNIIIQLNSLKLDKLIIINCKPKVMIEDHKYIEMKLKKEYILKTSSQELKIFIYENN